MKSSKEEYIKGINSLSILEVFQYKAILPPKRIQADLAVFEKQIRKEMRKSPIDQSFYIYGPTGCGKTTILWWLYGERLRRNLLPGNGVDISNVYSLLDIIRYLQKDIRNDSEQYLQMFKTDSWLGIDDFGPEKITDWSYQMLYYLINHRYSEMLPTVFTSNLSLEKLELKLGDDRVTSRIQRMCKIINKK